MRMSFLRALARIYIEAFHAFAPIRNASSRTTAGQTIAFRIVQIYKSVIVIIFSVTAIWRYYSTAIVIALRIAPLMSK